MKGSKGPKKFNEEARAIFLEHFAKHGRAKHAATAAGVCSKTITTTKKHDPEFAEAYEEAYAAYRDHMIEEVYKRGVLGYQKPIYQKGELVGYETIYSDTALMAEAKRVVPEYRNNTQAEVNFSGGVLVVQDRELTEEEWLAKYQKKAKE